MSVNENIKHLISHCGNLQTHEVLCLLFDETTEDLANEFLVQARTISDKIFFKCVPVASKHGEEPPAEAAELMIQSDLIISLCQFSLAHSQARIAAGKSGARFLSMPLYDWALLSTPAISIDFKAQGERVKKVTDILSRGKRVHVTTRAGTDITIDIGGRIGNCCPGYVEKPGDLGSPPDIESNVSPIETGSDGIAVIDGSITCPEIGLVPCPVTLHVQYGQIVRYECDSTAVMAELDNIFPEDQPKRRVLAECGIGLNPQAVLTGTMLTDEGALGCVHFGFGSNATVGGKNAVDFHLDFVMKDATLKVDDLYILKDGTIQL